MLSGGRGTGGRGSAGGAAAYDKACRQHSGDGASDAVLAVHHGPGRYAGRDGLPRAARRGRGQAARSMVRG